MRIACITETFLPDVNGVVTTLCRMLEHAQAAGHEVMVVAPSGAPSEYAGAPVVALHGVPLPLYPDLRLTPPQLGITTALRRFRPDVLHTAGLVALGPTARYVARALDVPHIATYHTDIPGYSAHYGFGALKPLTYRYMHWCHAACALTLCPSSATLADLRTHGFRRLRLWARGVDTQQFHPRYRSTAWRESVGAQPDETVLLYVGRLATEKRLDVLYDALNGLPRTRLVFVGDGPARAALQQRFAGSAVHFAGFLRGDALATAYASADMFVFPSDTDTFGQVIQEAMASGLPVVAARAGGALDLVRDGVTGALFTPNNPFDVRTHVRRLLADANLRAAMGVAGRAAAERRSWRNVMDELITHYARVQRHQTRDARHETRRPAVHGER